MLYKDGAEQLGDLSGYSKFGVPNISPLTGFFTSFWNLGEASGAARADSIGTNNLTNNNGVTQAAGLATHLGNSSGFAQASSQFLQVASNSTLTNTTSFAIAGWTKANNTGFPSIPIATKLTAGGAGEWVLDFAASTIRFRLFNGGSVIGTIASGPVTNGVVYSFFAWFDASGGRSLNLYVNNVASTPTTPSNSPAATAIAFALGAYQTGSGGVFLDGNIDAFGYAQGKVGTSALAMAFHNFGFGTEYPF